MQFSQFGLYRRLIRIGRERLLIHRHCLLRLPGVLIQLSELCQSHGVSRLRTQRLSQGHFRAGHVAGGAVGFRSVVAPPDQREGQVALTLAER